MINTLQYILAGFIVWITTGVPFREAMESAMEAKRIMDEAGGE